MIIKKMIVVIDFGGQYANLITNRLRRLNVYSELISSQQSLEGLKPSGIILSGGGDSVNAEAAPDLNFDNLLKFNVPILGICYGYQWLTKKLGGEVGISTKEYGATVTKLLNSDLFEEGSIKTWMSHGDSVLKLPSGFKKICSTQNCENAGMENKTNKIYGLQFHPETSHCENGMKILDNFMNICDVKKDWEPSKYFHSIKQKILDQVRDRKVFMLISGGVDSTVAYSILNKVLGPDRVFGVLIDNGLMRLDEVKKVKELFEINGFNNFYIEDANHYFVAKLKGVYDPEQKRKIIGNCFLDIKDKVANSFNLDASYLLGQGTIYPDTIESGGTKNSKVIKTHHNRVDRINKLIEQDLVVEPLINLYKDEVRELGRYLGLSEYLINRHPFPGPGLGVRLLCNKESKYGQIINLQSHEDVQGYRILPIQSVGVQGDDRTYKQALVVFLKKMNISLELFNHLKSLPNKISDVNRVLLCISHFNVLPNLVSFNAYIDNHRLNTLKNIDNIVNECVIEENLYDKIWQFPVVMVPVNDGTEYTSGLETIILRPIESTEAMTADCFVLKQYLLSKLVKKIKETNKINFVLYDITSKPPGTIEWE